MAKVLYAETNFAIGIAKGQDPDAERFLASDLAPIQLVIPGLCFIEAFSAWNLEEKQRRRFIEQLASHAREVSRDQSSTRASLLLNHLLQSQTESEGLINDTVTRLRSVLDAISRVAEIIELRRETVQEAFAERLIEDQTDNLILRSVLRHAGENPGGVKAFLSGNRRDFDRPRVRDALDRAGIKYFSRTVAALGWLRSSADNP